MLYYSDIIFETSGCIFFVFIFSLHYQSESLVLSFPAYYST